MKTQKIEELYNSNQTEYSSEGEISSEMLYSDFENAINQAELEWYQRLESKLYNVIRLENPTFTHEAMNAYSKKIQNKIKELEKC